VIAKKAKGRTMLYASVFHVPYSGRKLPFVFFSPLLAFVCSHGCWFDMTNIIAVQNPIMNPRISPITIPYRFALISLSVYSSLFSVISLGG
jgi:hypothetical protein